MQDIVLLDFASQMFSSTFVTSTNGKRPNRCIRREGGGGSRGKRPTVLVLHLSTAKLAKPTHFVKYNLLSKQHQNRRNDMNNRNPTADQLYHQMRGEILGFLPREAEGLVLGDISIPDLGEEMPRQQHFEEFFPEPDTWCAIRFSTKKAAKQAGNRSLYYASRYYLKTGERLRYFVEESHVKGWLLFLLRLTYTSPEGKASDLSTEGLRPHPLTPKSLSSYGTSQEAGQ